MFSFRAMTSDSLHSISAPANRVWFGSRICLGLEPVPWRLEKPVPAQSVSNLVTPQPRPLSTDLRKVCFPLEKWWQKRAVLYLEMPPKGSRGLTLDLRLSAQSGAGEWCCLAPPVCPRKCGAVVQVAGSSPRRA